MDDPSIEAAEAILGCAIQSPALMPDLVEAVRPEMFRRDAHRKLWGLLVGMWREGLDIDTLSVATQGIDCIDDLGGAAYVTSLPERVPSSESWRYHARTLDREYQRRQLRELGSNLLELEHEDPAEVRAKLSRAVVELGERDNRSWQSMAGVIDQAMPLLRKRGEDRKEGKTIGWTTGLRELDDATGGVRAPHVWCIAGRPGMGKTVLLVQLCLRLAREGIPVALFSLEMSAVDLCTRILSAQAAVDGRNLRDGQMGRDHWRLVDEAAERLYELPLYIECRPATASQVRARLQGLTLRHGPMGAIALDYLQLVGRDPHQRSMSRQEMLGDTARELQALGKEENSAVLFAAQLNREVEGRQNKRPVLSDLAESGAIEQVCDVVTMLYRGAYYDDQKDESQIDVLVRKARHGQTREIEAVWQGEYGRILGRV